MLGSFLNSSFVGFFKTVIAVVHNYFLLQEGVTERGELPSIWSCSDKLSPLLFLHYNWLVLLCTSVFAIVCLSSCRDLSLLAAHSGSQQNSTRQCSKVLENSASPGWCPQTRAVVLVKTPVSSGMSWLLVMNFGISGSFWTMDNTTWQCCSSWFLFVVSSIGWFTQHWNPEDKSKFLLFWQVTCHTLNSKCQLKVKSNTCYCCDLYNCEK